jgi:hypothetical protein
LDCRLESGRVGDMTLDWPRCSTVIGLVAVIAGGAGAGCATAISTVQPAEALPKGGWRVTLGTDVGVPVSRVADALDAAADVEKKVRDQGTNYMPTDEDRERYMSAILGLALSAPGVGTDVMVRYGLGAKLDLGARWTTTGLHGDLKWQFLGDSSPDDAGWHGAISLGYANHSFDGLIFDVLDLLQVNDFSRNDFEAPIIIGKRLGPFARTWFGPKLIAAKVHVDAQLEKLDATLQTDDWVYYAGGFAGLAAGWKGFEAYAELTVMDMFAKPTILGRERDLGGIVIMPAIGVSAKF